MKYDVTSHKYWLLRPIGIAMVPPIPPEIWIATAHFIPSSTLRNLYSVNSVFLNLALNNRYSDILLTVSWTRNTAKYLRHLNLPHIAYRVKRVTLSSNFDESDCLGPLEETSLRATLASYLPFDLGRFIDPILHKRSNLKRCYTLMQNIVLNFPNISSLMISDGSHPSSQNKPDPVLVNAYTACASTLRSLTLLPHSGNFNITFPPDAPGFTSLEEVTLNFFPQPDRIADVEAASTFFQAIASRLTTLNITYGDTSDEPFRLFPRQRDRPAFPKLTSFSLFHSVPSNLPSSDIIQFLNQHAKTLKHLRLQHIASKLFPLPVLPYLESLHILDGSSFRLNQQLPSWEGLDAARFFVQHSRGTLTSLGLTHCLFSLHDLGTLIDFISPEAGGRLKSLTVTVQVLSPDLLDMLAEKLPQLERLKVESARLRTKDVQIVGTRCDFEYLAREEIVPFLVEMKKRSYSRWALKSVGLDGFCVRPAMAMMTLVPLTDCIPRLVEIDAGYMKMWREPGSTTWMPALALCDLGIAPQALREKPVL